MGAPAAGAAELGGGKVQATVDTTISHGLSFRVQDRDDRLAEKVNSNDGNLNYDGGSISNTSKITSDFELEWGNLGAFDLEDAALDVRLGKHVLNWGESTFIQNGINAVNPFDLSKLRLPGGELREALQPVTLASAAVSTDSGLTVEGFYQLGWEEIEIDPVGSYFSALDHVGPGAERAVVPLPGLDLGDMGLTAGNNPFAAFVGTPFEPAFAPVPGDDPDFLHARRGADRDPNDSGQRGAALRHLAEELNDTEFGLYFMNYHSRLPVVGAHTGTAVGAGRGLWLAGRSAPTPKPSSARSWLRIWPRRVARPRPTVRRAWRSRTPPKPRWLPPGPPPGPPASTPTPRPSTMSSSIWRTSGSSAPASTPCSEPPAGRCRANTPSAAPRRCRSPNARCSPMRSSRSPA